MKRINSHVCHLPRETSCLRSVLWTDGRAFSMRRLLCAISANGHAAPTPYSTSGVVRKEHGTLVTLACPNLPEILVADDVGDRRRNRKQQCLGRTPSALRHVVQTRVTSRPYFNLAELLIASQHAVERPKLRDGPRFEFFARVRLNEGSKPFAQCPRLSGYCIELARQGAFADRLRHIFPDKPSLLEPFQQVVTRADPFNRLVSWRGDRVQEIEPDGVGEEERLGSVAGHQTIRLIVWP